MRSKSHLGPSWLSWHLAADVFDCPINIEMKTTRSTKNGQKLRKSRRHDPNAILELIHDKMSLQRPDGGGGRVIGMRVTIEKPSPRPNDGSFGWYSVGFGYGVWRGCLASYVFDMNNRREMETSDNVLSRSDIKMNAVLATQWKRDMHLTGRHIDKNDSRFLAKMMLCVSFGWSR